MVPSSNFLFSSLSRSLTRPSTLRASRGFHATPFSLFPATPSQRAQQLKSLKDANLNFDTDSLILAVQSAGPQMDAEEFGGVMKSLGVKEGASVSGFFKLFDKDGSDRISTQELMSGLSLVMNAPPKKRREMLFKAWDTDGDGSVDMGEFVSAMSDILATSSNSSASTDSSKTSEALFKELDTNNDGKLSFSEFEKAADRANSL